VAALKISSHLFALTLVATSAMGQSLGPGTVVYGGDANDGWAFMVAAPPGWNFACCDRARDLDANLLVFPDGWDGRNSDHVMVLTVWPKERADVDADWQADANDYFEHFPGLTSVTYQPQVKDAACLASTAVGADGVADHVVFCDPGSDWHYRFAWSVSLRAGPADAASESAFRATVGTMETMHMHIGNSPR